MTSDSGRPAGEPQLGPLRLAVAAVALYMRAAPAAAAARIAMTLVSGLSPVALAWFTKMLLDQLAGHRGPEVWVSALALALTGAVTALAQHLVTYADSEIGRRVTLRTQGELFAAVTREQGIGDLENPAFQDRLRLAQQSSHGGPQQLVGAILVTAQSALTVAGFLGVLITVSPQAALLVLLSVAPTLWAQLRLSRARTDMLLRTTPRTRRQIFYAMLLTDVRAAKEIRLFGLGDFFRGRMLDELDAAQRGERRVDRAALGTEGSLSLLTALVSGAVLIAGAVRIDGGHGDVGDISVLTGALATVQLTVASTLAQIADASQMLVLFSHYIGITRRRSDPAGRLGPAAAGEVGPLREALVLTDVWFRYDAGHDWILRGVNLTIRPGESIALVGLNGAGKTTLTKLLCRLYEPTRGTITWDGADLRTLDIARLRARIGVVFQDHMSYEMSAADNIAVGDLRRAGDTQSLREAARRAGVDSALSALPRGYDTLLSRMFIPDDEEPAARTGRGGKAARPVTRPETGVLLSGGQWQRLAIARAMLRTDADLLILDEPSSGLDAVAESDIHRSLRHLRRGRSSLLISHRLNTVRDADRIVVLDGGRVTEEGDHRSLLAAKGIYAELFTLQADGYLAAPS
ncbi:MULTISPECIES: ABC transporter ATP-binding protein [unclassified Streptomyces]|uniref:ABC transporter ATP-binding protein n=1 Tax=unclassified Streptomyces TaxID=2593676 RepID=UPI002ED1063A|nr:ABC transporter ATP-binding protein/permease [Streptomyces sp. NBC_00891]WSY05318.1 ABC transporter ATP-binding protein/permease [Streptomyces sp. NBC_00890]WSZ06942.1 ABC transporter ATP-binding protein/permease [Streptomyces sp. NBC_00869]WSZ25560.1 ABC transporter ATP-binding protein/permease [Streptomyces sp. NBC_00870]